MVELYHEVYGLIMLFLLLMCGLISIPLYFNLYLNSLHIKGPDWDYEMSVCGTSMYPILNTGDSIYVYTVDDPSSIEAALGVGNIIAFGRPDGGKVAPTIITHRAINKTTRNGLVYFQTKGDSNDEPDYWDDPRGENYSWNGMVSQRLLYGEVVGVRKTYALQEPVVVMAAIMISIIVADFVGYKRFMEKEKTPEWTTTDGKQSC